MPKRAPESKWALGLRKRRPCQPPAPVGRRRCASSHSPAAAADQCEQRRSTPSARAGRVWPRVRGDSSRPPRPDSWRPCSRRSRGCLETTTTTRWRWRRSGRASLARRAAGRVHPPSPGSGSRRARVCRARPRPRPHWSHSVSACVGVGVGPSARPDDTTAVRAEPSAAAEALLAATSLSFSLLRRLFSVTRKVSSFLRACEFS